MSCLKESVQLEKSDVGQKRKERLFSCEYVGRKESSTRCSVLVQAFPLDGQRMNHFRLDEKHKRQRCSDVFIPWRTSALALSTAASRPPRPTTSTPTSPGRLSNREEMLGISRCRAEDQMCGLEVVRQTKSYKAACGDTSEDGGQ